MENVGALSLILAFCLSVYSVFASLLGKWARRPFLILSAERAVYAVWALVTIASGILVYALQTDDFRLSYVAGHSSATMPRIYKLTAWWGGQEGSLLLWTFILSSYAAVAVFMNRRKFRDMMPYVTATLMIVQTFFLTLISFPLSPFEVLAVGKEVIGVQDGRGLNPLLQYWTMAIHPPTLYLGYVGFVVPFAFAMPRSSRGRRATPGSTPRAAGRWSLGCSRAPGFCSAPAGPTPCLAGAGTGDGTRWRTPRSFPGSPPPRSCIQ